MDIDNKVKESRLEEFIANPKKALWKLSLPMMFGMSVQAIYMMADTAFVGRMIGSTALASLGYVFPYFFILMGITFGLGSGATTVIAQFIGAKDKKNADFKDGLHFTGSEWRPVGATGPCPSRPPLFAATLRLPLHTWSASAGMQ